MNQYVVILSVGPVQGFIAAARRSRDLWSGSWLLSELAKACAKNLFDDKAELIFPATTKPADDLKDNSEFSVGNKIQVVVNATTAKEVADIVDRAKQAVQDRFQREADSVMMNLPKDGIRQEIWTKQIPDYVEVQAAWAQFHNDDYNVACDKAGALLAARKATRDFQPSSAKSASDTNFMLPKSSLDGARETVLSKDFNRQSEMARKLSLSEGEQLDSAGVIKRLGGKVDQFTPYTRIAAHEWIEGLEDDEVQMLYGAYEALVGLELATRVRGNKDYYAKFPYDGQYLYSFRIDAALQKYKSDDKALAVIKNLQNTLKPLWRKYGDPCRYSALLLADGDRMGELLDKATTKEAHKKITQALSNFANSVEETMREFSGHRIYAGGDDVLGFVPLHRAYDCAKALAERFESALANVAKELNAQNPTLSVGLAITHINTPLGYIRSLAQRAEKMAKGDQVSDKSQQRNALGITLAVRSGSTTDLRLRWDDEKAHKAFHDWMEYYTNNLLTSRIAYDTREVHLRTNFLVKDTEDELLKNIRAAEFRRMLEHACDKDGVLLKNKIEKNVLREDENSCPIKIGKIVIEKLYQRLEDLNHLDDLATELIIARWLSAKTQKDLGRV